MRTGITFMALMLTAGCTAFVVGGGGGYQAGKDERASAIVASDSAITAEIRSKFADDALVPSNAVVVRTYEGTVTLTGTVGKSTARDQAGKIAQGTKGVKMVNNQIVVHH
jgi:hyperosmotically inducible protein